VLGNPPWERIKLQEREWFSVRSPLVADSPTAAERKRRIHELKSSNPTIYAEFSKDKRIANGDDQLIRQTERYPLCGRGDVNTYAIFAETMRMILGHSGRLGCIVPTGIATDDTTKLFFREIMQKRQLISLYDFENKERIFVDVALPQKFCLITISGSRGHNEQVDFVFFALRPSDLTQDYRHFTLSAEEITLLKPNTGTAPIFRTTNRRTAVFSILPKVGLGNSASLIYTKTTSPPDLCSLFANLASFAFDYVARQNVGGSNLNYFILRQLPVLSPEASSHPCQWQPDQTLQQWILPRVLELSYNSWELQPFARDVGYDGSPFRWDESRRFQLRCELDAVFSPLRHCSQGHHTHYGLLSNCEGR
jgi:hypothetical protein